MAADDLIASRISNVFIAVDCLSSTLVVPLAALVLFVLVEDRRYSGSFFTIYKVGLFYDILSLVSNHVIGVIPTRGKWVSEEFLETQFYLKSFYCASYFTHTCQGATNLLLAINRATAVLLPQYHHVIWRQKLVLPACFIFQFGLGLHLGAQTLDLELYLMRYATGERFPMTADNPSLRAFWLKTFITAFASCIAMTVLYCVIGWKFYAKVVKAPRTKKEAAANRRAFSLLCVSSIVMASEIIYNLFYCHSFVTHINFKKDFRIFFALFFGITDAYSCLPTYLLIIFCKPIRDEVTRVALNLVLIVLRKETIVKTKKKNITVLSLT